MNNLIKLSDVLEDGTKHSVRDMLLEAVERAAENPGITKAIVLFLKEDGTVGWNQAGFATVREQMNFLSQAHNEFIIDVIDGL